VEIRTSGWRFFALALCAALSLLGSPAASAQVPAIGVSGLPADPLIGETFCVDVDFSNADPTTGYGPYLIGVVDPGISLVSVNFVDIPPDLEPIGTFGPSGELTDPISGTLLTGTPGGTATIARYPVGSVEQGSPPLVMNICAEVEVGVEIGVPLAVEIIPGFEFGDTSTGENGAIIGTEFDSTVTPQLARVNKTNSAPEGERPPGPSHTFTYTYTVNVSEGVAIENLVLEDMLPVELQWNGGPINITAPLGVGCGVTTQPNTPPTPGGDLVVDCTAVVGTDGTQDLVVSFAAYIVDILDESIPDEELIQNTVNFDYEYQADPYSNSDTSDVLAVHAAIQKTVSGTPLPGETLTYTIAFQVTDYPGMGAGANSFIITDILPDGTDFLQTDSLTLNGAPVGITEMTVAGPGAGETTVTWDVTDALGGVVPDATDGSLVYSVEILEVYSDGTTPVQAADELLNDAQLDYTLTDGGSGDNGSESGTVIEPNVPDKEVTDPPQPSELFPGEQVTFQLTLDIPAGNTSNVIFVDYLPRPVIEVSEWDSVNGWTVLPPWDSLTPIVTTDTSNNSVTFEFGDITSMTATTLALDLRANITGEPFADDLYLTNLFGSSYDNADGDTISGLDAAAIRVGAPDLVITKGVFSVDNPDATIEPPPPADPGQALVEGDATGADAFDEVEYVITIENMGGQTAYDVTVTDPAVTGLDCPDPPVVTDGNGANLGFSGSLQGAGIVLDDPLPGNDDNPPGGGAPFSTDTALVRLTCTLASDVSPGELITNTASVDWVSTPGGTEMFPPRSDDATVTVALPALDKQVVAITPGYAGALDESSIGEMITYQLDITVPEGESPDVRLEDLLDVGLAHVDVLSITTSSGALGTSEGDFNDVRANAGYESVGGGLEAPDRRLVFGPTSSDNGFGTVTNSNDDNNTDEVISVVYRTRMLNSVGNVSGIGLRNRARWFWTPRGGARTHVQDRAARVNIVEPALAISKIFDPDLGDNATPPLVTITLEHNGASNAGAFDLFFEDKLPPDMDVQGGAGGVTLTNCPPTSRLDVFAEAVSDRLEIEWANFPQNNGTCIIEFQVEFRQSLIAGIQLENCAPVEWESLDDNDQPLPSPPSNTLGVERTGDTDDTGGAANTYRAQACDIFKVFDVGIEKDVESTSQPQTDNIPGTPAGAESLTIGEQVNFELVVTIPEAVTPELLVNDILPSNGALLEVLSAQTVFTGSDLDFTNGDPNPTPVISDGNGDGVNELVELDYGEVDNPSLDGIDDDDRIIIEVLAKVLDDPKNANNDTDANRAVVRFLPGLESSAEQPVEIVEPLLEVDKSADLTEVEAGDEITYTVRVQHSAASRVDAQDVLLTDQLPPELSLVGGSVQVGTVCDDPPDVGPLEMGNAFEVEWTDFSLGAICDIEFRALVSLAAITGQVITNEADLQWTSLNTQGDPDDRQYNDDDAWDVLVSPPGLDKLLTSTSLPDTSIRIVNGGSNDLTIGESATFTLEAIFPDGTTLDTVLEDILPSDGVALDFVPGSTQITAIGGDLMISSSPSVGDPAVACVPPDSECAAWFLDTVVNVEDSRPEPDLDDRILFEVTAIVLDDPANSGSGEDDNKRNTAELTSNTGTLVASDQFNIVEPLMGIRKLTKNDTPDGFTAAGQEEHFTLVVEHVAASSATAFTIEITDELSPQMFWLEDPADPLTSDCPGFTVVSTPAVGSSGTLEFAFDALPLATRTCEIRFKVQMNPVLPIPGIYNNEATMTWESHPGSAESRQYSDEVVARLLADDDSFMIKRITNTSLSNDEQGAMDPNDPTAEVVAIGEVIEYGIVAIFSEGLTSNVSLEDTFQQDGNGNLALRGGSVDFVGSNISTTLPGDPSVAGNVITIDYGDVTNTADGVADRDDSIRFSLQLQVTDDLVNTDGDRLLNEVEMTFDGLIGPVTVFDDIDILVVEPDLALDKSFTGLAGDAASIELTLTNNGTSAAFDPVLTDDFDETLWVPGSLVPITLPPGFTISEQSAAGTTTVTVEVETPQVPPTPEETLLPGEDLVVEFSMQLQNGGQPGPTMIPNTANAEATSLPGSDPEERLYTAMDSDTLLLPALDLLKTWSTAPGPQLPGDTVTYTLDLLNTGDAEATVVVVTDTPDALGTLQVGTVAANVGGSGATATVETGNNPGDTDIRVSFDFIPAGDTFTVSYDVLLPTPWPDADTAPEELVNQAGAESAELSPIVSDDPDTPATDDPTVVPVVADPVMTIDKMDGVLFTTPGAELVYNIQYGNAGDQDATGVVITETVPQYTTFVPGSSTAGWTCDAGGIALDTCRFTVGDLGGATSTDILFAVQVDAFVPSGVIEIVNDVSITDDGREFDPGAPVIPSTDDDQEITPLLAAPALEILKDDGGQSVVPGQTYFYTLSYRNTGNQVATGVIIRDAVPVYTTFNAAASQPTTWSCADGSPPATICEFNVGSLAPGATSEIARFGLQTVFPAPAGAEVILNAANIEDDGSNTGGTPITDSDGDTTPFIATPDMVITKSNDAGVVRLDEIITYEIDYNNAGNQDATGVIVRETVPRGTEFLAADSLPTVWSCPDGSPGGTVCSVGVGDLGAGNGGDLSFAVRAVRVTQDNQVLNVAEINDDGTNGTDPTPENNITRFINVFRIDKIPVMPLPMMALLVLALLLVGARHSRRR